MWNIIFYKKGKRELWTILSLVIGILLFTCMGFRIDASNAGEHSILPYERDTLKKIFTNSIFKTSVFNSGDNSINSFRIPSLVTTKKGSLLLFCEARKLSWRDKSPTDIVFKRSTDNGKSWSEMVVIAEGGNNAFMDPCAIVDKITGRIFLFTTLWPQNDRSVLNNTAWMMISDNDGITWSAPKNITSDIVAPDHYIDGFGPGSGLQMMKSTLYPSRLILPTRQMDRNKNQKNRTVYSDDHGHTWKIGQANAEEGEFQIAQSPVETLIYNLRSDSNRLTGRSNDGGLTWEDERTDTSLISVSGGCQGSVLGVGNILFYSGPAGCKITDTTDNRANLTIYRSNNGGVTWQNKHLLYDKASGYSCITQLNNGDFAIVFETADTNGFIRIPGSRPAGWMRLDVMVLPKEIALKEYWF